MLLKSEPSSLKHLRVLAASLQMKTNPLFLLISLASITSIRLRPFRFGQMALASIKFLEWLFGSCFSSSWTAAREAGSFGVRTEEEEVPRAPAIRRPPRLGRLAWGVLNFSDLLSAGEQSYLGLLMSRISFWSVSFGPPTHAYLWAEIQSGVLRLPPRVCWYGVVARHSSHRPPTPPPHLFLLSPEYSRTAAGAASQEQQARTVARLDQAPRRDTNY